MVFCSSARIKRAARDSMGIQTSELKKWESMSYGRSWENGSGQLKWNGGKVIGGDVREWRNHNGTWSLVTYTCNLSYSGGRGQKDHSSKPAWANSSWDPISKHPTHKKRAGSVAQMVEHLVSSVRPWVQIPIPRPHQEKKKSWWQWVISWMSEPQRMMAECVQWGRGGDRRGEWVRRKTLAKGEWLLGQ
jgi:hypothetical protein